MKWNYRIIKIIESINNGFGIYEVFYNEKGEPHSLTSEPISIFEENIDDLKSTLKLFNFCLKKPILIFNEKKNKFEGELKNENK